GLIRAYRNGAPYGTPYRKSGRASFPAGESQVLIGLRHGAPSGGRLLRGVVREARLHLRALSEEEVQASYSGGAFVSRAEVLAALDDEGRARVEELEESVARARAQLSELGEPAREEDAWSRVAHAMFNLKEFLYLR
ncbi:MAG: LamG domain-containing protein, partial [Planctomycetes bacterium]|nr:LamG domain-containing protein [Planctomycetota bacterium]